MTNLSYVETLEDKIQEFIEDYVFDNYAGIGDPTSEHATVAPAIYFHEGAHLCFLQYLSGATGDKRIDKFLESIQNDESYSKLQKEEETILDSLEYIECKECGTVIYDEDADYCPNCGANPNTNS